MLVVRVANRKSGSSREAWGAGFEGSCRGRDAVYRGSIVSVTSTTVLVESLAHHITQNAAVSANLPTLQRVSYCHRFEPYARTHASAHSSTIPQTRFPYTDCCLPASVLDFVLGAHCSGPERICHHNHHTAAQVSRLSDPWSPRPTPTTHRHPTAAAPAAPPRPLRRAPDPIVSRGELRGASEANARAGTRQEALTPRTTAPAPFPLLQAALAKLR